jgi:transcriptional/translational regulatory protein YebC/TACO1
MFEKKGQLTIEAAGKDEDTMMEAALEAGAEDFRREDEVFVVTTTPNDFHSVKAALEKNGIVVKESELAMVPKNTVKIAGKDADALLKLLEELEDLDDVQKVWANFDIDVDQLVASGE